MAIDSLFSSLWSFFSPQETPKIEETEVKPAIPAVGAPLQTEYRPERPILTPPRQAFSSMSEYRLLAATDMSRTLGNQILDTLSTRLQNVKAKISEISAENIQKLKEAAERAKDSDFWSILKKIATALVSAASVVLGIAVLASGSGALVGGAMIASGILSLANFALSELGTWDWVADQLAHDNEERKKNIAMYLPGAIGILAGGIGILGSVNSIATNAVNFAEQAAFVFQGLVATFSGMTTLGKGAADARLLFSKAAFKLTEGKLNIAQENFTTAIDEIKGSMADFRAVNAKTKKAVETIVQTNIELVR